MAFGPSELEAILLSLRVGFWSVLGGLPFAYAAAWLLARRSFPGKLLLDALLHLPLVLPPVAVGFLLLQLADRGSELDRLLWNWLGITLAFSWQGAALAAAVMAFPLMVRPLRQSLEAAGRGSITLALLAPGLVAGALLGFARSFGEFGATLAFVSQVPGTTRTLPLALFDYSRQGGEEQALRLTLLSLAVALLALVASELLVRHARRRGKAAVQELPSDRSGPGQRATQPAPGGAEAGSVIAATVSGLDLTYGLSELRFPGGTLRVPRVEAPIGSRLQLRIRPQDVSLALAPPSGLSIQNVLPATVTAISGESGAGGSATHVRLAVAGTPLHAWVTRRALAELALAPGRRVYALIDAAALDSFSFAPQPHGESQASASPVACEGDRPGSSGPAVPAPAGAGPRESRLTVP